MKPAEWTVEVETDFEGLRINLLITHEDGRKHLFPLGINQALYLSQLLIEKSLNVMEHGIGVDDDSE